MVPSTYPHRDGTLNIAGCQHLEAIALPDPLADEYEWDDDF